jgi:hypothetical protein
MARPSATIEGMAKRLIAAIEPRKPIDQMTAAEKRRFVDQVVARIAAATKAGEGK